MARLKSKRTPWGTPGGETKGSMGKGSDKEQKSSLRQRNFFPGGAFLGGGKRNLGCVLVDLMRKGVNGRHRGGVHRRYRGER